MPVIDALDLLFRGNTQDLDKSFDKVASRAKKSKVEIEKASPSLFSKLGRDVGGNISGGVMGLAKSLAAPIAGFLALKSVISHVSAKLSEMAELHKTAMRINMRTDNLQVWGSLFKRAGLDAGAVEGAMLHLNAKIGEAAHGSTELQAAFKQLGLSAVQMSTMTGDQKFRAIAEAMAKIGNQSERMRLLTLLKRYHLILIYPDCKNHYQ